jgi:DNA-binding MarR family transcriptional regulator
VKSLIYEIIAAAGTIDSGGQAILKPFGLTPMTFNILNVLKDGPLSQREISERVIVAASSITFQVRQLQKKGLLQRRRADARTWRVSLTPAGAQTRERAERTMDEIMARIRIDPTLVASAEAALKEVRSHFPELARGDLPS